MMREKIFLLIILLGFSCSRTPEDAALFREAEQLESKIIKNLESISICKSAYEQILEQFPESTHAPQACVRLAKLNEIFGHYAAATTFYQKLLTQFPEAPECAEALFNLGQIYELHTSDRQAAIETYQQLVFFFPENPNCEKALLQQAQLYCQQANWGDAVANYEKLVQTFPNSPSGPTVIFRTAEILREELQDSLRARAKYELVANYPNAWTTVARERLSQLQPGGTTHETH